MSVDADVMTADELRRYGFVVDFNPDGGKFEVFRSVESDRFDTRLAAKRAATNIVQRERAEQQQKAAREAGPFTAKTFGRGHWLVDGWGSLTEQQALRLRDHLNAVVNGGGR